MVRKKDTRHRAREAALQILYQWDVGGAGIDQAIDTYFSWQWPDVDPPSEAMRALAEGLARGTVRELAAVDPLVAATAEHWRPERMPIVDRLVLRMATYELLRGHEQEKDRVAMKSSTTEVTKTVGGTRTSVIRSRALRWSPCPPW